MTIHASVTSQRICDTIKRNKENCENTGICIVCGKDQDGCEPDARKNECESCGSHEVYGAEELLMMI